MCFGQSDQGFICVSDCDVKFSYWVAKSDQLGPQQVSFHGSNSSSCAHKTVCAIGQHTDSEGHEFRKRNIVGSAISIANWRTNKCFNKMNYWIKKNFSDPTERVSVSPCQLPINFIKKNPLVNNRNLYSGI